MKPELNTRSALPWHDKIWVLLREYLHSGRTPQALLITGRSGLGKFFLAKQLSQSLLCQQHQDSALACFNCSACQLFSAETHPDYLKVVPESIGKSITINQIRALLAQLCLQPHYEQHRAVVINPADQMNHAAANAFLKCLEEPPSRTVMILVTETVSSLPATIVSRCQQLSVTVPSIMTTRNWLDSQGIHNNIDSLVNMAAGAPLLAYQYAREDTLALRQECFLNWCLVATNKQSPVLIAELWFNLASDELLDWLVSWVMDLIKLLSTHDSRAIANPDFIKPLQELGQRLKLKDMFELFDLLLKSRQYLQTQLNKQLIYEEILVKWSTYNRAG